MKRLHILIFALVLGCAPSAPEAPRNLTATTEPTPTGADRASSWPSPIATPPPERSEIRQLPPVDHAVRDREFAGFRDKLLIDTREKDHAGVLAVVNPKIRTSFGAEGGINHFITMWHPEDPKSGLWAELEEVLELGGSFTEPGEGARFCAPYPYSEWPEDLDSFEYLVVTRAATALKASRDPSSTDTTPLGFEFVRIADDDPVRAGNRRSTWRKVTTLDGKQGWVDASHVRSPVDYRACFSRHPDGWKMDLFVAGD